MKIVLFGTLLMFATSAFGQKNLVVPTKSKVTWHGEKVVGGGHHGTLDIKSGFVEYLNKKPVRAQVVVDMKSLKNSDLTDPAWNKKLVDHLHSNDFFSTAKFPAAEILVNKFSEQKNGQYNLYGNLTIKNIIKPVQLTGKWVKKSGSAETFVAELEFDRTDFNVRYGSGKFFENLGDKMISDKVKVKVDLTFKNPIKTAQN